MRIVAGYIMRGRNAKINKMKKEGYEIKIYARGQK